MIPTPSGEKRELRDCLGWLVKTRDGEITRIISVGDDFIVCNRDPGYALSGEGRLGSEEHPWDIVLILGPEEEKHEDGTTTKMRTVPVRLEDDVWETHEVARFGRPNHGEDYATPSRSVNRCEVVWHCGNAMILRPKPQPTPSLLRRIAEAVVAGEVVLPPKLDLVQWDSTLRRWNFRSAGDDLECFWRSPSNGPLPPWTRENPTTFSAEEIEAEAAKVRGEVTP